jgi:hypothetical protein
MILGLVFALKDPIFLVDMTHFRRLSVKLFFEIFERRLPDSIKRCLNGHQWRSIWLRSWYCYLWFRHILCMGQIGITLIAIINSFFRNG